MRRKRGVALSIVAILAITGLSVLEASASAAEYYWCKAQKKGEYANGTCTTKSSKPKKGSFELKPVEACEPQKKGEYTNSSCTAKASKPRKGSFERRSLRRFTVTGGKWSIPGGEVPDFGPSKIICTASTGDGEITSPTTGSLRLTMTGCEYEGIACKSEGPNSTPSGNAGVIVTNLLDTKLIGHGEGIKYLNAETDKEETYEPGEGQVGYEFYSAEHQPYLWEWDCGGMWFIRSTGELTGVLTSSTVNHLSSTAEVEFKPGRGAQGILSEVLTEAGWVGPAPATEEAGTSTITFETGVDVKS
jgi:hypothetical protein